MERRWRAVVSSQIKTDRAPRWRSPRRRPSPRLMRTPRGLGARGALAGLAGGGAAAVLEFALSLERAAAFLPSGRARLLWFLLALYGSAGALAGGALGLLAAFFGELTDL